MFDDKIVTSFMGSAKGFFKLFYPIHYRIMYRMKVTAIIPDQLIKDVKAFAKVKTTTEALVIAISEWIKIRKLKELHKKILAKPIEFQPGFTAAKVRALSRRKR